MKKLLLFILSGLFLASCHGAAYHYKQGNKFAQVHGLKRAVTEYKMALDRKPNKVKYMMAMETHGNALLEELYTNYRFADGTDSLAVYKFLEAEKWTNYLKPYISVDRYEGFYSADYQVQLNRYMSSVYDRSHSLIRHKEYEQAQKRLKELDALQSGYRDVKALLAFSEVEPIYTAALEEFENGMYKEAYATLEPMVKKYPEQRELKLLMEEALERGMYRIGIISDPNLRGKEATLSAALQSRLISELYKSNDPFIELLDRTNFELLQSEQEAIIQGQTSEDAITEELLTANAYLKVVVTTVDEVEGRLHVEDKKGYERYYVKSKNDEGETIRTAKYKKVRYKEYHKENRVHYTAELTLTDRATSKILAVKSFDFSQEDRTQYISYGNDQLFPGYWKYQYKAHYSDRPELNESKRRNLDQMRRASRNVKSPSTMRKDGVQYFARQSASYVNTLDLRP